MIASQSNEVQNARREPKTAVWRSPEHPAISITYEVAAVVMVDGVPVLAFTPHVPASDLAALPPSLLVPYDSNGDGVDDHEARTRFEFIDMDGDGRITQSDGVKMHIESVARTDPRVPLRCEDGHRAAIADRVLRWWTPAWQKGTNVDVRA